MQNKYRYDAVDNILGITNAADPMALIDSKGKSNGSINKAKLGGASHHSYEYDDLNRLIHASGKAKNASYDMAMTFGLMSEPLTKVQKVDSSRTAKSYDFVYRYEDDNHPTAPTQIGHDHYTYDAEGNPILIVNDSTNTERKMYWDEDDRLMVLSDNGRTSRYTYNAAGDRIIKSHGTMEGVYINGAPQGITFHETDDFTLYPASILTVNKNRFTKHYFIGSQRIASRIGTGSFNNVYGRNNSYVTAGQQDYAQRMADIESQREKYYKQQGIAPGVPTEKGAYGDPENTGVGYNSIITELGDHSVPEGWVQTPKHNDKQGSNPGAPISWNDPTNPDDPQPGYGYIADDTTNVEDTYFFHSDHLGSTSYITDANGNVTQYDAYLPYGELLVDEHSSSEDMPYKFNGKEFDEETGLYYYGSRYMDPVISMWYGVDPNCRLNVHIGSYVFCSDNPLNRIDPKGADDYFNAAGKFVRRTNTKTNNVYIWSGKNNILLSNLDLSVKKNRQAAANIVGHYANQLGLSYYAKGGVKVGKNPHGMVGIRNTSESNELASTTGANITLSVYNNRLNEDFNDYENILSTLFHESIHKAYNLLPKGLRKDETEYGHVKYVQLKQFENVHFQKGTTEFQEGIIGQAAEYLQDALKYSFRNQTHKDYQNFRNNEVIPLINQINKAIYFTHSKIVINRNMVTRVSINE